MFSFFSSRQRQHERTLATLNQITLDAAARMQQDADRANRRAENAREEMHEESHNSLMKLYGKAHFFEGECYRLRDELADYKDLAAYWSNSFESCLRAFDLIVEQWHADAAPGEDIEAKRARLKAIRQQAREAVIADESWAARREEKHQARIKQRRG